jgi:type-F conjugative transfer system pilin assembly protein TrbC
MADHLLKESQQQLEGIQGEVQEFVQGTKAHQEKSFFGFTDQEGASQISKPATAIQTPPIKKKGSTCSEASASSKSDQNVCLASKKLETVKYRGEGELFVFVSLGMGDESLKALSQQAQAHGGTLVIQGLVGNSFQETHKRLMDLGIPIDIDPTLFERFEVVRVPTFVLTAVEKGDLGAGFDKVSGNSSVISALELFAQQGDLTSLAQSLLKKGDLR